MNKLYQYGRDLNSHDLVKIVAVGLMVVDHVGQFLLPDNLWFRVIGRGAAPLFFFLIGYDNRLHITTSLITYGLILSFIGAVIWNHAWFNILITFIFSYFVLIQFPPENLSTPTKIICFILLSVLNGFSMGYLEYGFLGILWMYSARLCALKDPYAGIWLCATAVVYLFWGEASFHFSSQPELLLTFAVIMGLMWGIMLNFEMRTYSVKGIFRLPGLILSRYSLEIYFYHLLLLQAIGLYLLTHK